MGGKERVDVLSFSCEQRSLMEDLPRRRADARDALGVGDPAFQATSSAGPEGPTADVVPAQAGTQSPSPPPPEETAK